MSDIAMLDPLCDIIFRHLAFCIEEQSDNIEGVQAANRRRLFTPGAHTWSVVYVLCEGIENLETRCVDSMMVGSLV